MKKMTFLAVLAFILSCFALPAVAGWWTSDRTEDKDFIPYLENGTAPQHAQQRFNPWTIEDWAPSRKVAAARLDRFFKAGVLVDSTQQDGRTTLVVGPGFYHLSDFDKYRVVTLFRHVTPGTQGLLYLQDHTTERLLGTLSRTGQMDLQ